MFMRRVKAPPATSTPVMRKFVVTRGLYDFGPLLTWKSPEACKAPRDSEAWKAIFGTNGEALRVTNNGPFATVATMSWEKGNPQGVFSFEPPSLPLAEGETKEVVVWAFPKEVGVFEDALLVSLQDNPSAYRFPMTATGQLPALQLKGTCSHHLETLPCRAECPPPYPSL